MPKDKVSGKYLGYGFVEYRSEDDADYAMKVLNMVKLYGKPIKVNKASQDKKLTDVGANIFIGNLDPDIEEKLLYDTFSAFGSIVQTPKILFDPESGLSKGYGFVSYDSFEASDMAIECMNGQFLCNRAIVVQYAYKKDTPGERHGSQAERILASASQSALRIKPHAFFSGGQGEAVTSGLGQQQLMIQQQQQQLDLQQYHLNMQMQMQMQMMAMQQMQQQQQQQGGQGGQPPVPVMPPAPPSFLGAGMPPPLPLFTGFPPLPMGFPLPPQQNQMMPPVPPPPPQF
jgi:splicing factor 3B subunit 4